MRQLSGVMSSIHDNSIHRPPRRRNNCCSLFVYQPVQVSTCAVRWRDCDGRRTTIATDSLRVGYHFPAVPGSQIHHAGRRVHLWTKWITTTKSQFSITWLQTSTIMYAYAGRLQSDVSGTFNPTVTLNFDPLTPKYDASISVPKTDCFCKSEGKSVW